MRLTTIYIDSVLKLLHIYVKPSMVALIGVGNNSSVYNVKTGITKLHKLFVTMTHRGANYVRKFVMN
jgi:hypothetical protein